MIASGNDQLAVVRQLKTANDRLTRELESLKRGGGGGTLPPMDTIDAKIAAAEARTDTKFAELRHDLSRFATKGTVWGAVGTALGIVLAVLAFAGDRFDAGISQSEAVERVVAAQRERDRVQDAKLDRILEQVKAPSSERTRK